MAAPKIAIPGQLLGSVSNHVAGPGTHVYESNIYASIAGPVVKLPSASATASGKQLPKSTLAVSRSAPSIEQQSSKSQSTLLPVVGSTVLCAVTRVQSRQAMCLILTVVPPASTPSSIPTFPPSEALNFPALLRREDIRLTEKDRVVMNDAVRVGDLIRAQVISIGDERQYYVSTAGNEFGVLAAKAEGDGVEEGGWMTGVSWKEMRDLRDNNAKGESRKVAKPT